MKTPALERTNFCRKLISITILGAGILLTSAFFNIALAAEGDLAPEQIDAALKDLGGLVGQTFENEEQAKEFCNQEKNFDTCTSIGKKHNLYSSEEVKQVDQFLNDFKGVIVQDLKNCSNEECLIDIASRLSKTITSRNPQLASQLNLTTKQVDEKKGIIAAAKEAGVNFRDCQDMDPDIASIDLLRACARLAKDTRVQNFIPENVRAIADQTDKSIELRSALVAGKFSCGDGTLQGCGNFCLNPATQAKSQGTSGIPEVCRQIATEFFGQEGIKQLESSYTQISQIKNFYSTKLILTTPDGKEIIGKDEIRSTCDRAFSSGNIDLAKSCGNFAVQNGFASEQDVREGLDVIQSFIQKGSNVKFEDCIKNPEACREFVPEERRQQLDLGVQLDQIMRSEIGFDPRECSKGQFDQSIGQRCFEGSQRALPKLESLAVQYPEAKFMIDEIKSHISRGEELANRKDDFKQIFEQQGGPGSCKNEQDCRNYCSDPSHGPECIAFGAKFQIFKGGEAIQRFQEFNQNIQRPQNFAPIGESQSFQNQSSFPGQGPYQGFQPPAGTYTPPGQIQGFTQPGPGFGGFPGGFPGGGQGFNQPGPSPECFAAIQAGEFEKAKTLCTVQLSTTYVRPVFTPLGTPFNIPTCSEGQYWNGNSCVFPQNDPEFLCRQKGGIWENGNCRDPQQISTFTPYSVPPNPSFTPYPYQSGPGPYPSYSPLPGTSYTPPQSCPSGQWWDYATSSCKSNTATYSPAPSCPSGQWWDYAKNACMNSTTTYTPAPSCPSGQWWDFSSGSCKSSTATYSPSPSCLSGQWWDPATNSCKSNTATYSPYPSGSYTPYPSPTSSGSCPSGSHTMYVNNAGGYCMSDADTSKCAPLNSTSVSSFTSCSGFQSTVTYSPPPGSTSYTPYPTCPSGQWWDSVTSSCKSSTATYSPPPSCPSGQWWDYSTNSCKSSTATYSPPPSCPSGQYWDYATHVCLTTSTTTYTPLTYTPYPTYSYSPPPVASYTPYPTTEYTPPPATSYTPYPTTEYSPPPTYSSPPPTSFIGQQIALANTIMACADSGGKWNGKSCISGGLFSNSLFGSILKFFGFYR